MRVRFFAYVFIILPRELASLTTESSARERVFFSFFLAAV